MDEREKNFTQKNIIIFLIIKGGLIINKINNYFI
jgi:hypothetical protein